MTSQSFAPWLYISLRWIKFDPHWFISTVQKEFNQCMVQLSHFSQVCWISSVSYVHFTAKYMWWVCDVLYTGQCMRSQAIILERQNVVNKFNNWKFYYPESFTLLVLQDSCMYNLLWYRLVHKVQTHLSAGISHRSVQYYHNFHWSMADDYIERDSSLFQYS